MSESKGERLPKTRSIEELVELFDHHDLGDYMDHMPEIEAEIELSHRRHFVELADDVAERLEATARRNKLSSTDLVNAFLREKLAEAS